jgi:hypothetical protein
MTRPEDVVAEQAIPVADVERGAAGAGRRPIVDRRGGGA